MVRPCVARRFRRAGGERSCINVSGLSLERAPGHHGYQRACELITGKASTGPFGSPVFACAGKTEPPSRLILSQTSVGNCQFFTQPKRPTPWLASRRASATSPNAPSDPCQFVGERDRKNIAMQSFLGRLDPRF